MSLANFFRGKIPAVTPKDHEARCSLGPRRQRLEEEAIGLFTKGTQRPTEGGGSGERAKRQGKRPRKGPRVGEAWVDGLKERGRVGGWIGRWMEELM